ncbi:MAG: STAS domain-containing protein [Thermodesulfobacteriota bacterium]
MKIEQREEQGVMIVEPAGRLDSNTAPMLDQVLESMDASENGTHLIVDFSSVEYISSAGLRVILKAVKDRQGQAKSFAASGMQEHVREIFEISGFDSFVEIYPDFHKALASFS